MTMYPTNSNFMYVGQERVLLTWIKKPNTFWFLYVAQKN